MGNYTSESAVRRVAGFTGNSNVSTDSIEAHITHAEGTINAYIARRYTLPLDPVPVIIADAATKLAAGYVLWEAYGPSSQGTDKDGGKYVSYVLGLKNDDGKTLIKGIVQQIADGDMLLLDSSGTELARSNIHQPIFYPNNISKENPDNPTAPKFRMNDNY